jgi:hypothetical protein
LFAKVLFRIQALCNIFCDFLVATFGDSFTVLPNDFLLLCVNWKIFRFQLFVVRHGASPLLDCVAIFGFQALTPSFVPAAVTFGQAGRPEDTPWRELLWAVAGDAAHVVFPSGRHTQGIRKKKMAAQPAGMRKFWFRAEREFREAEASEAVRN